MVSNAARVRHLSLLLAAIVRRDGGELRVTREELEAARAPLGMADDGQGGVVLALGDPYALREQRVQESRARGYQKKKRTMAEWRARKAAMNTGQEEGNK